jgi:hypothetical protein
MHSLGEMEVRQLLGKRVFVLNHASVRRYYSSRNRLIVWRQYWKSEARWILADMRSFFYECIFTVLYEKQAGAKLRMIARGLFDGIRNVRGALDSGR